MDGGGWEYKTKKKKKKVVKNFYFQRTFLFFMTMARAWRLPVWQGNFLV